MITCWVIYIRKYSFMQANAKKFTGVTYAEIDRDMKEWQKEQGDIEILDVAESVYEDDEE